MSCCLQLDELKQVKDSPIKTVMEKLSSARSEASSLSEQLAAARHDAEVQHKENLKLQKVTVQGLPAHCIVCFCCRGCVEQGTRERMTVCSELTAEL